MAKRLGVKTCFKEPATFKKETDYGGIRLGRRGKTDDKGRKGKRTRGLVSRKGSQLRGSSIMKAVGQNKVALVTPVP